MNWYMIGTGAVLAATEIAYWLLVARRARRDGRRLSLGRIIEAKMMCVTLVLLSTVLFLVACGVILVIAKALGGTSLKTLLVIASTLAGITAWIAANYYLTNRGR